MDSREEPIEEPPSLEVCSSSCNDENKDETTTSTTTKKHTIKRKEQRPVPTLCPLAPRVDATASNSTAAAIALSSLSYAAPPPPPPPYMTIHHHHHHHYNTTTTSSHSYSTTTTSSTATGKTWGPPPPQYTPEYRPRFSSPPPPPPSHVTPARNHNYPTPIQPQQPLTPHHHHHHHISPWQPPRTCLDGSQRFQTFLEATRHVVTQPTPDDKENRVRKEPPCSSFVTPISNKKAKLSDSSSNNNNNNSMYSRKTKSLGLLCENFCKQDWSGGIGIDVAAKALGVERRRIYDIINILESLGIVRRLCKNSYHWIGFGNLSVMLSQIQQEGLEEHPEDGLEHGLLQQQEGQVYSERLQQEQQQLKHPSSKTKRSLGKLSRQFLQLFLVGHPLVSLNEASDRILGAVSKDDMPGSPASKQAAAARGFKTKIRRLYDIANVLQSLELISKVVDDRKSRPTFTWAYRYSPRELRNLASPPTPASPTTNMDRQMMAHIHECGAREPNNTTTTNASASAAI